MMAPVASTRAPYVCAEIDAAIASACNRIAPLWPLKHFVAVNPFLGFSGQTFAATCATLHRVARIDMLLPRAFYRRAIAAGEISEADLAAALATAPADWAPPPDVAALKAALARDVTAKIKHAAVVATVAEILDSLASGDRIASGTAFMTGEISKWCAAYFDEGQSVWRLPGRGLRPYAAWRVAMRHDRNPEVMGVARFRAVVAALPDDPREAIVTVLERLDIPQRAVTDYLHQALLDIAGWAAYARYLVWNDALYGRENDTLVQLLAIRVVWGYTLFVQRTDAEFRDAWRRAMDDAAVSPLDDRLGDDPDLSIDLVAHEAYEIAYQRVLLAMLAGAGDASPSPAMAAETRPAVQAAFCIDVRSEVYRRALETAAPDVQTMGYAGFFGFPIEYVPIGYKNGGPQCPVLLTPQFVVCETVTGASAVEGDDILRLRILRRRAAKAWKSFKTAAVASFIFVETAGILFAAKIVGDSLSLTRTVHDPDTDGLAPSVIGRLGPGVEPGTLDGRPTGFDDAGRVTHAEAVLRGMSLTSNFARIVLLTGHGSTTVNNPHASGLDCGACGGHTGEANARVASAVLNDPRTRAGLRARGIEVPDDTWFVGALHDTTTDHVTIYDTAAAPATHRVDLDALRTVLARATSLARRERAPALNIPNGPAAERRVVARSRDWAQVRPEWGLAGNAALIVAPRGRTRGLDLGGRVFLHDYDERLDPDHSVLAGIMSAPMVVASWINLQYYGSAVNNPVFGSGNKVLHNVAGIVGVLEGNGGDLKAGLPWQSVHDGTRFVHDPLRLSVFIDAALPAIEGVIAAVPHVRDLIENRWLHLFAFTDDGIVRYRGGGTWDVAA